MHRQYGSLMDEVRAKFFTLTSYQFASFLVILERAEGKGARDNAERSYQNWRVGLKKMAPVTEERVLKLMPRVLGKADKMELVEKAWDIWSAKRKGRLWIEIAPTATFQDVVDRIDDSYRNFKTQRFTSEDYASLKWLFDSDAEALKETLTNAEQADAAIILEAIVDRSEEIKAAAIKTAKSLSFVSNLQFEFPFATLTLIITNKPSPRALGTISSSMNESPVPSPSTPPNNSNLPAKIEPQNLKVQNLDGTIASDALGNLISTLPKAEQDRLNAKMAERLMELQARQAAGHIDTNNVRREVNEVLRSSEELDRMNARYEIKKDIDTEMGKGTIQIKREEIREKTVTIGGKRIDSRCFIATACYGELTHPNLVLFRTYRDEVLLKSSIGRAIVKSYYAFGPYAAVVVKRVAPLRVICTAALDRLAVTLKT